MTGDRAAMSCPRFVQNTWKRDLCSNCFKAKEDHPPVVDNRARYLANLKEINSRPPPPSILKGVIRKNVSAIKVHFPSEESQVIGYGGDDEFSDNEEEENFSVGVKTKADEDTAEDEEDKNFQRLTDSNTQFNMDPANLRMDTKAKLVDATKKSTTAPLKLGQVKSTPDGKKQTLLVSVQPFGAQANTTLLSVSRKTHLNNLLHDATDSLKLTEISEAKPAIPSSTKPEAQIENETDVVCKNNVSEVKSSLPEAQHVNNVSVESPPEPVVNNSQNLDSPKQDCDKEESNKKTDTHAENRLSALIEGKKSQITRGTILTKTHEQAKSKRYFQLGPVKPEEALPVSESLYQKFDSKDPKTINTFSKAKDTISMKSLHQKNSKNLTNGLFSSKLMKKEFGIQSDLQLTKMKSLDYIDLNKGVGEEKEAAKTKRGSLQTEVLSVSVMNIMPVERTEKDEVFIIDGVPAESREMVGEPDGKADSDDLDEPPPDLPTTPPPLITEHIPRPSFLHNLIKDKPKLPSKPNIREKSPPSELILDEGHVDGTQSDPNLSPNSRQSLITKRQAPKPPPTPTPSESPPKQSVRRASDDSVTRDRKSSCSPLPSDESSSGSNGHTEPVTVPTHRALSLSHETLACVTPPPALDKKKGNKMRSTIRKFLRLASREEMKCEELGPPPLPPPRPRPEIIHPLDLNKAGVQVLRSDGSLVQSNKNGSETPSSPTSPVSPSFLGRPSKPPPPPRSQSLDSGLGGNSDSRPARPPPPQLTPQRSTDSVYVNLGEPTNGEVRSTIVPVKPQRTASLREKDTTESSYQQNVSALQATENLYESLAPECDLNRDRSSLPYYGSETESDIYCPYTFANSHKGGEEDRASKTRSVVHKNLEDNYGAVIVANHEALTQLLEQVNQMPMVPAALRPLKTCSGLQWTDFSVGAGGEVAVGGRVFLPAQWSSASCSLCLTPGQARLPPCLAPIVQFFDLVASQYLHQEKTELVQVSVAVLARQQFYSLAGFLPELSSSSDVVRESALLMVQIVNCLKSLQAEGVEEASMSHLLLFREQPQSTPRVCFLPNDSDKSAAVSLCRCAVQATESLSLPQPLASLLRKVLLEERAISLTQAKATLELWLWGPTHLPNSTDTQSCLQRWLDLERATLLQSLAVRRPLPLPTSDHCHLAFLVRTNAKSMADALTLLNQSNTADA